MYIWYVFGIKHQHRLDECDGTGGEGIDAPIWNIQNVNTAQSAKWLSVTCVARARLPIKQLVSKQEDDKWGAQQTFSDDVTSTATVAAFGSGTINKVPARSSAF